MEIATFLSILVNILAISIAVYFFHQINKNKKELSHLFKMDSDDVMSKINKFYLDFDELKQNAQLLDNKMEILIKSQKLHYKKIGFQRYNPYHDTGGNLSFALVLLNDDNNGILIDSMHNREITRVYAKEITNGIINGQFSSDEKVALDKALI